MKQTATAFALVLALGALSPMAARAAQYTLTGGPQVLGQSEVIHTRYEDTLIDLAREYGVGYPEILRVNPGVDPWLPGAGTRVVIPGRYILPDVQRKGIVVNVPEHRLYYFPKHKRGEKPVVITYPASIGKVNWQTPTGLTYISRKIPHPAWYPPASIRKEHAAEGDPLPRVVPAGPDNPLGQYALRLALPGSYLIHGTNNPRAVGLAVTHGCIRLYPEDIKALFHMVPVHTQVRIINQPVKVAFVDGELLLEVHQPVDSHGAATQPSLEEVETLIHKAVGDATVAIDWPQVRQALQAESGVPVTVGLQAWLDPTQQSADSAPAAAPDAGASVPAAGTATAGAVASGHG